MRARNGFTLVELLVVIGVISVLIAILLPALAKAREAATTVQCLSNLRQCGVSLQMYQNDFNGVMACGGANPSNIYVGLPWMNFLDGHYTTTVYLEMQSHATHCPKNTDRSPAWWGPTQGGGNYAFIRPTTYLVTDPAAVSGKWGAGSVSGVRITAVRRIADYILLADSAMRDGTWGPLARSSPPGIYSLNTWLPQSPTGGGQVAAVWMAHPKNKANALFADGHAETCDGARLRSASNYNPNEGGVAPGKNGITQWWDTAGMPLH